VCVETYKTDNGFEMQEMQEMKDIWLEFFNEKNISSHYLLKK